MKNLLAFLMMTLMIPGFSKEVTSGKVVTVIDGNTVQLTGDDNESYKIVLQGIDCPELGQEFGDQAKLLLSKLILDKNVSVQLHGKDRWGNNVGIILINGTIDPRYELLEAGLAWTSERNPVQEFEAIKNTAKENGKGLWQEPNPTPPWVYRRQQTLMQVKSS
ncbi:MAG: hypothetical protein OJF59_001727 [Cytophagales bacterium]|jgi:endonuclease YncB( thermonuclease family)|nr:thermonuclease family protein [Bacteroidota bacterium]MBS1980648.1 thermonuclease family protein [Bacteroidota bacterium]WHZ07974.1 MAG: hypothetical protein OJF59_001727 [Cytophagales bacterium]